MSDGAGEVSTCSLVDTKDEVTAGRRRRWPEAVKRQIVAETRLPGASVSMVARRHDVNANQVFKWRRQYEAVAADHEEARVVPDARGAHAVGMACADRACADGTAGSLRRASS